MLVRRRRGDGSAAPTTSASQAPAPEGGDAEEQLFELASAVHPTLSVEVPEEPIASAPAGLDGFSLDVLALERESESSVYLVFALRSDSDAAVLFQSQLEDPTVDGPLDYANSAVSLFDAVNLKRHLVFVDDAGGCLCSLTSTVDVEPGDALYLAALFPAPPADVESMTVQTPIGSVSSVPLAPLADG